MTYINITKFALISLLEKDHDMIETRRLKNVLIFIQTILRFVLSRKIILKIILNISYRIFFSSFHVGDGIVNLLLLYDFFIFFHV